MIKRTFFAAACLAVAGSAFAQAEQRAGLSEGQAQRIAIARLCTSVVRLGGRLPGTAESL